MASYYEPERRADPIGGPSYVSSLHRTLSARCCFAAAARSLRVPAAWGDLIAGVLAITATIALSSRSPWALAVSWLFNIWGAADLLFAFYQGARTQLDPGALGPPSLLLPQLCRRFSSCTL
jgi:hypothetical protein